MVTPSSPTDSDTRPAYSTRENMSRPSSSVPNRYSVAGGSTPNRCRSVRMKPRDL